MNKIFLGLVYLLVVSSALHVKHVKLSHKAALTEGKVNLKSDTGIYLARCNGCGAGAHPDSATIHSPNPNDPWVTWTL
jgi:hypothetical protein